MSQRFNSRAANRVCARAPARRARAPPRAPREARAPQGRRGGDARARLTHAPRHSLEIIYYYTAGSKLTENKSHTGTSTHETHTTQK